MKHFIYPHELDENDKAKLEDLYNKLTHNTQYYAGYPPNTAFNYVDLYSFLQFSINNLGDPFIGGNEMSSHRIECEVLNYFARITNAPQQFSGYVTNGSTEGNLYGLYLARKMYPNTVAYFSNHSHYSIPKNLDILNIPYFNIETMHNGEIDYDLLYMELQKNRDKPALIIANIGTTVVSAIDNINKIKESVVKADISQYFIHADAAFDGMILPFIENPPPFSFSDGIDSITISGHKLIGSPIPCGIVLTKKKYVGNIKTLIEYVDKPDTTISGSRNGITPVFLWYAIKRTGDDGFKKIVYDGFAKAEYAIKKFKKFGINAWKNEHSLTVVFPAASKKILTKWNIPTAYGYSQITLLPKLTYPMIDEFCVDMAADIQDPNAKLSSALMY